MRIPLIPYKIPEFAASETPVVVYYRTSREIEQRLHEARVRSMAIGRAQTLRAFGQEHDEDAASQDMHLTALGALKESVERIKCGDATYAAEWLDELPTKIVVSLLVALAQGEFDPASPKS